MKNFKIKYRLTLVWFLMPLVFLNTTMFAGTGEKITFGNIKTPIESSVKVLNEYPTDSKSDSLPFELPNETEENTVDEVENTTVIYFLSSSFSAIFPLCCNHKQIVLNYIAEAPLPVHHDITSPPPK